MTLITTAMRLSVAILFFFLVSSAGAQTHRGSVRGTVYDPAQAVIQGAQVTLTSIDTGEQRSAVTESDGEYAISSSSPGVYDLRVEKQGFTSSRSRLSVLQSTGGLTSSFTGHDTILLMQLAMRRPEGFGAIAVL